MGEHADDLRRSDFEVAAARISTPAWSWLPWSRSGPPKPETASRVRGRVEAVLDWATARGLREGENPARWKGHLEKLPPAKSRVHKVEHHAALTSYAELSAFMAAR